MNFYNNTSKWRLALFLVALIVVLVSVFYTNYLVKNISIDEKQKIENYKYALKAQITADEFLVENPKCKYDFTLSSVLMENTNIPIILVSELGEVSEGRNFGEEKDTDIEYLTKELNKIQKSGKKPISIEYFGVKQYIYYKDSNVLRMLQYYPFVMFFLIATFIGIGFLGFKSEKNAEQNRVWAGLAKETAHQLGTPISGMVAWLEHLKLIQDDKGEIKEIVDELEKDVDRLMLVADRFSKIGSDPELQKQDIVVIIHDVFKYMERRAPKRVIFTYPSLLDEPKIVKINPPLFEWVLENLLRNALDASGNKGRITGEMIEDEDFVYLDISDTGKGIPDTKFNSIFKPGFTTKKRGWGLGLSLAKRIIESYHNGKIFVKESTIGEGTTFRIQLPK